MNCPYCHVTIDSETAREFFGLRICRTCLESYRGASETIRPNERCAGCGGEMARMGQVPLRINRPEEGDLSLLLGPLAHADETVWPVDVYRCCNCRRIEMYDALPRRAKR